MDFMKVFDQTVREIKREVNLKVLKVPEVEQKVLDATDNEPWGPHGTALAEIAQATKKFSECQMVMGVLWTRLGETGKDWCYVYKALAVIEYLISHGSDRAVDEIIEHTYQISSLMSFEHVEPSGKDMGINVRKKAEKVAALLNDRDKIQEVRNKAAANRDKYIGLSSTGITYRSGSASFGVSYQSSSRNYDSYDSFGNSRYGSKSDEEAYAPKKSFSRHGRDQDSLSSGKKLSTKQNDSDKYGSITSHVSGTPSNNDDDFDDFDPRGTSDSKPNTGSSNHLDLFGGQSLIGDLLDEPMSGPTETSSTINSNGKFAEADLFADVAFVSASASPQEMGSGSQTQKEVDLFAESGPSVTVSSAPPTMDLFASPEPAAQPAVKIPKPESANTSNFVDPFAAVPLNNFDGSDPFGAFTTHLKSAPTDAQCPVTDGKTMNNRDTPSLADSNAAVVAPQKKDTLQDSNSVPQKKDSFQVKSGIWADSLSRGLIDLNITAPKKVSLADVGIVGDLSNMSDERQKAPVTTYHTGWSMGTGSGLGRTGLSSAQQQAPIWSDDFFSSLSTQQYQSGGFKN